MAKQEVPITGAVLTWAREESALSQPELASRLGVGPDVISQWEVGDSCPTQGQFTKMAEVLRRPTALFFLPVPPCRGGLPTRFRNAPGLAGHTLSQEEIRHIRWARRLQDAVLWALRDQGMSTVDLPRFSPAGNPGGPATQFRSALRVSLDAQLAWEGPSEAFRAWRSVLEAQGVFVLQLPLGRGHIRGFSAWDDMAPLIAVNTAYHPTARIFTLFHEVGHLLTRTDAACLRFIAPDDIDVGVERWCERFAAELLMPKEAVLNIAERLGFGPGRLVEDVDAVRRIAGRFKVSARAVSLRLQELRVASPTLYRTVERVLSGLDWNPNTGGGGGKPASEKRLGQLGRRIPAVLLESVAGARMTSAELADYLRLTTGQVDDLRSLMSPGRG